MTLSPKIYWALLLWIAGLKLLSQLPFIGRYGFHRDEFLYMALGEHPAFGYWSNPPLIGWISWLTQHTLGDALWATRLPALLGGSALVILAGLTARELGGGKYAQALAGLGICWCPAYLRSSHMFQPVIFDVLFWAGMSYFLVRYLGRRKASDILWFGALFGLGFLNKYNVVFLLLALAPVLLASPLRRVLWSAAAGKAALIAAAIILPNMIWQWLHDFPVVNHLSELAQSQLGNVRPSDFLFEQVLFNMPVSILWLSGLGWLLFSRQAASFRVVGYLYLAVIAIFLLLSGKSYYSMGIYPVLIAAGAVAWESWVRSTLVRVLLPVQIALTILPFFPLGVPVLRTDSLLAYCRWMAEDVGLDAPLRWEDGRVYSLPQDYADMLGWPELAATAARAMREVRPDERVLLYAENYGQAGAIDYYGRELGLPPAVSFADSYRLWAPPHTDATVLIYINDELGEDIGRLFEEVRLIGQVEDPLAREQGTGVYLCRQPREDLDRLWSAQVKEVRAGFGGD